MKSTVNINYDNITIASEHLNGCDPGHCKNALWSIYNVIAKTKKTSTDHWQNTNLDILYAIGKVASFKDDGMATLILPEDEKLEIKSTSKKNLTASGFTISNKGGQALSYKGDDFANVIFGLKLFASICEKSGAYAAQFFRYGDISIACSGADIPAREKEIQAIIDYEKSLMGILSQERFNIISDRDRAFIAAFDKEMNAIGYNFIGNLSSVTKYTEIPYSKGGTSKTIFSRIRIWHENGEIVLRLYFTNIDKCRSYIENAPAHIKAAFAFEGGDCKDCMATCKSVKKYAIDGQEYYKCCHSIARFNNPIVEKMPDYMALLAEFFPKIKQV